MGPKYSTVFKILFKIKWIHRNAGRFFSYLANLRARSFASEPEFTKKTTLKSLGKVAVSLSA